MKSFANAGQQSTRSWRKVKYSVSQAVIENIFKRALLHLTSSGRLSNLLWNLTHLNWYMIGIFQKREVQKSKDAIQKKTACSPKCKISRWCFSIPINRQKICKNVTWNEIAHTLPGIVRRLSLSNPFFDYQDLMYSLKRIFRASPCQIQNGGQAKMTTRVEATLFLPLFGREHFCRGGGGRRKSFFVGRFFSFFYLSDFCRKT